MSYVGANGFFGAGAYTGYVTFYQDEFDHNGGFISNLAHNVYMQASATDPTFKLTLELSYLHDTWQGHLFKSRAQTNVITSNYFQGGVPQPGAIPSVAESYLLDVPWGGVLIAHGNLYAKNKSGTDTNGVSIAFGEEGTNPTTTMTLPAPSIDIEHNNFGIYSATYDGSNVNFPFLFFHPPLVPGTSSFPTDTSATVVGNAFGGYCPSGQPTPNFLDYRGTNFVNAADTDFSSDFVGPVYTYPGIDPGAGEPKYFHINTSKANFGSKNYVGAE